jgi:hypothetical protein
MANIAPAMRFGYTRAMPRFTVTGPEPDRIDFGPVLADTPLEALHLLHAEALGKEAVQIVDGQLVFSDPADQEMCAGAWTVVEFRRNGTAASEIPIAMPTKVAA